MINTRKIGGVLHLQCSTTENMERRQGAKFLYSYKTSERGSEVE